MKERNECLFGGICVFFSVVLLVLSMLGAVRLAALREEISSREAEAEEEKSEIQNRRAAYESMLSLPEIERYAEEILGMQHCSRGQIVSVGDPGI